MLEFDEDQFKELKAEISGLTEAIRSISHGPTSGPTGLEALTMAVAGEAVHGNLFPQNLCSAIRDGLSEIADAIREIKE